jgi:hypothetical protein
MPSKARSTPVDSPAPGVIPHTIRGPVSDRLPVATGPDTAPAQAGGATAIDTETPRDHSGRTARHALNDPRRDAPKVRPSNDPKAATQPTASAPGRPASALGFAGSERDERRHQRAVAREGNDRRRGAKTGERLEQGKSPSAGPSRRGRLALGETVSVGLIAILVVGLIVGGILGALGAPGWFVGLLVATLTLILSPVLRRSPRHG